MNEREFRQIAVSLSRGDVKILREQILEDWGSKFNVPVMTGETLTFVVEHALAHLEIDPPLTLFDVWDCCLSTLVDTYSNLCHGDQVIVATTVGGLLRTMDAVRTVFCAVCEALRAEGVLEEIKQASKHAGKVVEETESTV